MRLGPTFTHHPKLEKQRRLSCSKCKAEFIVLQLIKINDKQLCIWCAGHPITELSRSFTLASKTRTGR
jgi:formylmethanofuran dehydrogenase subunit E